MSDKLLHAASKTEEQTKTGSHVLVRDRMYLGVGISLQDTVSTAWCLGISSKKQFLQVLMHSMADTQCLMPTI
jgi:hypothetical protein